MPSVQRPELTADTVIIGLPGTCRRLERQLDLMPHRPTALGWILAGGPHDAPRNGDPVLGTTDELEVLVARHRPELALVCLPSAMHDLVVRLRTRLRRLGVPDRFVPTLEDQVAGIGPRTEVDVDLAALLDRPPRLIDDAQVRRMLAGRRVLITGAGGSIGSELARRAARCGPSMLILVERAENALFEIDRQVARRHPDLVRRAVLHDVVDAPATRGLFETLRPDVVFHAAAHKHVPMMEDHPAAAVDNNLFGTRSVVDAADAVNTDRFVMISTDKAVHPSSIMGATKRLAELYVQHVNRRSMTRFSMVRFGNVLGSSGSVIDTWRRQIAEGGPLTVTDPRMTRYFMTIGEAAALVLQAAALEPGGEDDDGAGEVFLLDMGAPVRIVELAERLIAAHGLVPRRPGAPATDDGAVSIVFTGARPGEKLHETLAFEGEALRPTRHPAIHTWLVPPPGATRVETICDRLAPEQRPADRIALARLIRELTPEMVAAVDSRGALASVP